MNKFPKTFLLGAATAAHQVEGNNTNSDCWTMEHMKFTSFIEPSEDAVDHYNRYEEDIILMENAGLNAYRFSLEWARIEPQEGIFDEKEIRHYEDMIDCCRAHGIEPIVTLHHFSSPKWLISKGGWEAESTISDFERYVRYCAEKLGNKLNIVCTINEANMGIQVAAIAKRYMMQMQAMAGKTDSSDGSVQVGMNLQKMMEGQKLAAQENVEVFGVPKVENFTSMRTPEGDLIVCRAHEAARKALRELAPHVKVGLTLSLHDIQIVEGGEEEAAKTWNEEFLHYLPYIQEDDFLGVQNYTRTLIGKEGQLPNPEDAELTQMNYEYYPEALEHVIRKISEEYKGDLIVTENGIATADDTRRVAFIETVLNGVQNCINDGLPVKGYLHWSLMDNFEWQKGYSMQFGLIAVDRSTQTRTIKPSLNILGSYLEK